MIESNLGLDMLVNIFSFFDKKTLLNYDSALMNKKNREVFFYLLRSYKNVFKIKTCKWVRLRGIQNENERCNFYNIEYISGLCKNLQITASSDTKWAIVNINNDNLEKMYIDLGNYGEKCYINSIKCKKLTSLTMVYVKNINYEFLNNIIQSCPLVKKIIFFYCDNEKIESIISKKWKIIKSKTKMEIRHE